MATSHTRLKARDHCTSSSTLIGGKGRAGGPSSMFHTTFEGATEYVNVVKVYMDSYKASNGTFFMVAWTIFKTHVLEASLTQN